MFFVFNPVPDIKLSFDVIILPFSVFHAVVELAFIPLFISVGQYTPALEFTIDHDAFVNWTIR